jgi:hypothetical protein
MGARRDAMFLTVLFLAWVIVVGVDVWQKRRDYLRTQK